MSERILTDEEVVHFLDLKPHVENEVLARFQRLSQQLVNCADGFAAMADTLYNAQQALVGLGVVLIMQSAIADSHGSWAMLVRRYRYNEQTQQVEEVPLNPDQVQALGEIWNRHGIRIHQGHDPGSRDRTVMIVPDFRTEHALDLFMNPIIAPGPMIEPAPHVERVRMQGLFSVMMESIADMFRLAPGWVLGPLVENEPDNPDAYRRAFGIDDEDDIYSPGEDDTRAEIAKVLMDFVKQNNKEDFIFLARSEAHIREDKIEEVWNGARRKLRLDH